MIHHRLLGFAQLCMVLLVLTSREISIEHQFAITVCAVTTAIILLAGDNE